MYASFNRFNHNVYRDATIVTTLDTFTSLLAGFTIFGILGHLAHETGTTDIGQVVKGGAGLAFISYPDAIARFKFIPQVNSNCNYCLCTSLLPHSRFHRDKRMACVQRNEIVLWINWLLAFHNKKTKPAMRSFVQTISWLKWNDLLKVNCGFEEIQCSVSILHGVFNVHFCFLCLFLPPPCRHSQCFSSLCFSYWELAAILQCAHAL